MIAVSAAKIQPCPVLQDNQIVTMKPRLQFFHAVDINYSRTMNAQEFIGIEPRLERTHGFAQQMDIGADVHPHVVIGSLDPVDLVASQKHYTAGGLYYHSVH